MATPTSNPPPEDIDAHEMLHEEPFYDGRQTALLFGTMGLGFLFLLVILFLIV